MRIIFLVLFLADASYLQKAGGGNYSMDFSYDLKKHPISEAELKQYCCQDDNYAVEDFGQSLDQLLLMKMIESVE